MTDCHVLVISDIHLGSRVCRAEKVIELLEKNTFETLIVNGDLFDSNKTRKLTGKHWEVILTLSEIAKKHKVILVGGNHGRELDVLAQEIGIEIKNEYAFMLCGNRFLCLHGDEFDLFLKYFPITSDIFSRLYYQIQRLDGDAVMLKGHLVDSNGLEGRGAGADGAHDHAAQAVGGAAHAVEEGDGLGEAGAGEAHGVGLGDGVLDAVLAENVHDGDLAAEGVAAVGGIQLVEFVIAGLDQDRHAEFCPIERVHDAPVRRTITYLSPDEIRQAEAATNICSAATIT